MHICDILKQPCVDNDLDRRIREHSRVEITQRERHATKSPDIRKVRSNWCHDGGGRTVSALSHSLSAPPH